MGGDELLWDRWVRHARERPEAEAVIHWTATSEPVRYTWQRLVEEATAAARWLAASGIHEGDVCAIALRHHPLFYPLYMGLEALGALPAVIAYPNQRLHPDKFAEGLAGMARRSGLDFVLTERTLEPAIRSLAMGAGSSVRGLLFPVEANWKEAGSGALPSHGATPTSPCLLQHSSGTTGLQKAVVLSHRAVLEHVGRYGEAIALDPERDRVVSWLPLYHDMGLIAAFHMALAHGVPTVQLDPFEWVSAPALLLEAAARERATLTWLPNFAYHLIADRVRGEDLEGLRLDSLRLIVNCSEPVRAEAHRRFLARLAPFGLRADALSVCYAMAETTFAVTQTGPGRLAPPTLAIDRAALGEGRVEPARAGAPERICVSCGRPISGCDVRIVDSDRTPLPAGRLGEIAIRSVSLFDGYRNRIAETARVLEGGWYYSGDLGFLWDGELYVIGRQKDVIIVAGTNLYPEDIEDAVSRVPGVLPGRVVAFGTEDPESGTERVCVIAETAAPEGPEQRRLTVEIMRAGMNIDVTVSRVYLRPARWLIKSSAGKPSRQANRERILAGEMKPAA